MNVKELQEKTGWTIHANDAAKEREIQGVFVGDLLSWVMGHGEAGQAWLTVQSHLNVVAVSALKDFSCIVLVQDAELPEETLEKAEEEELAILQTSLSAYEAAKQLASLGL